MMMSSLDTSNAVGIGKIDVDGPLVGEEFTLGFGERLCTEGLLLSGYWEKLCRYTNSYANGDLAVGYGRYTSNALRLFGRGLRGMDAEAVYSVAEDYVAQDPKGIHSHSKDLVSLLKEYEVLPVLVSGMPEMLLHPVADAVGVERLHAHGTLYEKEGGIYTGKPARINSLNGTKNELLERHYGQNGHVVRVAVGDTMEDIHPGACFVAINPNPDLLKWAEKNGHLVVYSNEEDLLGAVHAHLAERFS